LTHHALLFNVQLELLTFVVIPANSQYGHPGRNFLVVVQ
jgi:hypothetical protein